MRKTKNIQNTYKQKKTQTQNTKPPLKNNSKEKDWKEGRKQGNTQKHISQESEREKKDNERDIGREREREREYERDMCRFRCEDVHGWIRAHVKMCMAGYVRM